VPAERLPPERPAAKDRPAPLRDLGALIVNDFYHIGRKVSRRKGRTGTPATAMAKDRRGPKSPQPSSVRMIEMTRNGFVPV